MPGDGDVLPILKAQIDSISEIKALRARIDEIDREILRLLEERMEVALRIGEVKARLSVPILDPAREMEVLERAGKFRPVFEAILEVSRDVQRVRILQQDKRG